MALPSPRMQSIFSSPPDALTPRSTRRNTPRLDPAAVQATAGAQSEAVVRHQNHGNDSGGPCKPPARFFEVPRKISMPSSHAKTDPITHRIDGGAALAAQPEATRTRDPVAHRYTEGPPTPRFTGAAGSPRLLPRVVPPCPRVAPLHLGGEDLSGPGTRKYVKSDCPPSSAYGLEVERRIMLPAQRGQIRTMAGARFLESPDMEHIMRSPGGERRPLEGEKCEKKERVKPMRLFSDPIRS